MKPLPAFLLAWLFAGFGAVIGSILGHAAGKAGLIAGAILGGLAGIGIAVAALSKLQWLPPEDRRSGFVGGMVGFIVAAPVAVTSLHTPVIPVLVCGLAGAGLLLGVGVGRGWRR